jgi:4-amino-4-deoxy-L-arabinose transferase-like glycosyltransferase
MSHRLRSDPLAGIVILSVLLRTAAIIRGGGSFEDPDNYLPMARSLASGQGFTFNGRPTAYRPPLYPLILVPTVCLGAWQPWGIALLHLGLGAGTVGMTAAAANGFGWSRRQTLMAATITACDPVLVWQARSVMTETPAAFLVAASLAALARPGRRGAVLGGAGFGLAALCRPSLLAPAGLTVLARLLAPPGSPGERTRQAGSLALAVALVLSPWMIRNLVAMGHPIWTTTHGGYTLALANNPVYYREVLDGPPGRVWTGEDQFRWFDSVNRETAGMTEHEADRHLQAEVWRLARRRPRDFARATLARLAHLWSVAPAASVYPTAARWVTIAWTLPLWAALGLGLWSRSLWCWPRVAAAMVVFGLTLVHALFWTDLRMRAPAVPAIALIAAGAGRPRSRPEPGTSGHGGIRGDLGLVRGAGELRTAGEDDPARHREA